MAKKIINTSSSRNIGNFIGRGTKSQIEQTPEYKKSYAELVKKGKEDFEKLKQKAEKKIKEINVTDIDTYTIQYANLDEDIKEFFKNPESIVSEQNERIANDVARADEYISQFVENYNESLKGYQEEMAEKKVSLSPEDYDLWKEIKKTERLTERDKARYWEQAKRKIRDGS